MIWENKMKKLMRVLLLMFTTLTTFVMASSTTSLLSPTKALQPFEKTLWDSLTCSKDYTLTQELLKVNPNYFKNLNYPSYSFTLGENYIGKSLDLETLMLLVDNGLDLNAFTRKHARNEVKKVMKEQGYNTYALSLDYGRLKQKVKNLLQEHNMTQQNYYERHKSYTDYFLERLARHRVESLDEIKWFLDHGYQTSYSEMNQVFLEAIGQHDVNVTAIWKGVEKLGANFKMHENNNSNYDDIEDEYFMNSVVYNMMIYHRNNLQSMKSLIAAGLDINAKNNYGESNAYNLVFSEKLMVAKRELQTWIDLGLNITTKCFWSLSRESLTQITKMNLPISTEAEKVLEERNSSNKISYIKKWLLVVLLYTPILLFILTIIAIIFLIALVRYLTKKRK